MEMPRTQMSLRLVACLAAALCACAAAPAAQRPAPANAPSAAPSKPVLRTDCPATQPPIDSSCEAFEVGTGCLYANDAVGCSCMAVNPAEQTPDAPWKRAWRCGEHGEG
jgi:hypothetical protein